jgi:molecular chaperone DnaJ
MPTTAAYRTLELQPGASAHDIKRAYRRLAMRWHPDRNPAPDAQARFQQIQAAFELLHTHPGTSTPPPEAETSRPADSAQPQASRGADLRQTLDLDLLLAALGGQVDVTVEGRVPCSACDGQGEIHYTRSTLCPHCHGSGRIRSPGGLSPCTACDGRGFTTRLRCPSCSGQGWQMGLRQLHVQIPPGMLPDEELRIGGLGSPSPDENGDPGDLYLQLRFKPHPWLRLEGRDLHLNAPVSIFRALAGGVIQVPGLKGLVDVELPALHPTLHASAPIRLAGIGYPGRGTLPAGDLVVHLEVHYPTELTSEQKAVLDMADQVLRLRLSEQSPALARWQALLDAHR